MANDDNAPSTTTGNPFSLLAYVLFQVRHALEDQEDGDRPPRWVRIARGREVKQETIGSGVDTGVQGLAEVIAFMAELTMDLEELLLQTDAAKALAEVSLELIKAATDSNFQNGVATLTGVNMSTLGILTDINQATTDIQGYLGYIPEPEDVRVLGEQLYGLLAIDQLALPRDPTDNSIDTDDAALLATDHLKPGETGKVRLMAWAYERGVPLPGLGADEDTELELKRFGSRRLFATDNNAELPQRSKMPWSDGEAETLIFDFAFSDATAIADLKELVQLLQAHGYNDPAMSAEPQTLTGAIRSNLLKFQAINALPISGELDGDSINRLMNLDYARRNLRRAKRYDEQFQWPWPTDPIPVSDTLTLINPGAEDFAAEGLALVQRTPHPYYEVPLTPGGTLPANIDNWPLKQGWIADPNGERQFVALHSRARNPDENKPGRFVGGKWSEGEASVGGRFFFAARHTEPWRDGRSGIPGADALHGGQKPTPGARTRMYQWVPLPDWLSVDRPPSDDGGWTLHVYASVMQRSLFSDRDENGFPDQGRILLEVYGSDVYEGNLTAREPASALGQASTDLFPKHATTAAALELEEIDRKRFWTLRRTRELEITAAAEAVCLIAEGIHQSAYDTDAYFDDFRLHYVWRNNS